MEIELLKPHVHAGKVCSVGAQITLDKDLAEWLISVNAAKPAKPADSADVAVAAVTKPTKGG